MRTIGFLLFTALFGFLFSSPVFSQGGSLRAGAAKIDITPAPDALPAKGYPRVIRDHIYVRAIVIDNGLDGGYIPTDDAYGMNTFQVLGSKLKPGCAERALINGFPDLMDKAWR